MGSNFLRPIVTPEAANLDIVAVHGLNPLSKEDHAYNTWTANGYMWLKDFLPEQLPHARILLFGYNANAGFNSSTAGVTENAGSLLNWLKLRRVGCLQTRPIVFIAHGLGGIIVKKALIDAQANVEYQNLDIATLGIVFFGTPHNGSDHTKLGNIAANIAQSVLRSPSSSLLESLKKNSFFADELRKQFRQKLMHYWILSFYETRPSGKIGVIVEERSAVLGLPGPHETSVALNSNHSDICRFSSKEDDAYYQVSNNIVMLAKQDPKRSSPGMKSTTLEGETGKAKRSKGLNTMPTDNANSPFIGREKILEQLRDSLLLKNSEHARAALWGLGGSGKTRIARALARKLRMDLPEIHIFWVYAATEARVRQSYVEIAAVANLEIPQNPRGTGRYTPLQEPGDIDSVRQPQMDIVQRVNNWLQSDESGHWLVILDSADSHSSLIKAFTIDQDLRGVSTSKNESLAHMLPRSPMGAILVTTRNKKLALDVTDILLKVPLMDDLEAEELVSAKLQHINLNQIEVHSLVTLLEYLPLALVQAAAYIHKTSITIHKYLDLYNENKETQMRLLETDFIDLGRDQNTENAVLKTWMLSFEQIKLEDSKAANLLSIMSFLDAKSIPESLLQVEIPDSLDLVDALATLKAFALVTSSEIGDAFDMHGMVQSSMQRWLKICQQSISCADRTLWMLAIAYNQCLWDVGNEKLDEYLPHAMAALVKHPGHTIESRRHWAEKLAGYLPHAMTTLIKHPGHTTDSRWHWAMLGQAVGLTLFNKYQNTKAYEIFKEVIRLWTLLLGDTHFATLEAIGAAGENLQVLAERDQRYTQEAEELLLRASNGLETVSGPQALKTMTAKVALTNLYIHSNEFTKAKNILKPILGQSEDTSEAQEKLVRVIVDAKYAMAQIYLLEGNRRAAEAFVLEIVRILERAFTRGHLETQTAIFRLAFICTGSGELDKAKNLLEEVVRTVRHPHGKTDPAFCRVIQDLATVYGRLGRFGEALGILKELLSRMQEHLFQDDLLRLSVIEEIALSLNCMKKYDEEIGFREQALAMRRQRQGFDHVETLKQAIRTAKCYLQLQRYDEALDLYKEVVPIRKRVLGEGHPATLETIFGLAGTHLVLGQFDVGMTLLQEVFLLSQRIFGDGHPGTREVRKILEALHVRRGIGAVASGSRRS